MDAFKQKYAAFCGDDTVLQNWWIQDPATGKQDPPFPHQLLLKHLSCHIDGNTLCYKQGVTPNWLPIGEVTELREGLRALEEKVNDSKEMQDLVAGIPARPDHEQVPFDHQHTTDACDLLIWDIVDECWRPVEDYELLVKAEQERRELEQEINQIQSSSPEDRDGVPGTSVLQEIFADGDEPMVATTSSKSAALPKNGNISGNGVLPSSSSSALLVGNGAATSSSSSASRLPQAGSASSASALQQQQDNNSTSGGKIINPESLVDDTDENNKPLSKNALKRKRWREKKKIEKLAGVYNASKNVSDIYLSQLPLSITVGELYEIFKKCGVIVVDPATKEPSIKLYKKDGTDEPRGDGLVKFVRKESVQQAIDRFHGQEIVAEHSGEKSFISVQVAEYKKEQLSTAALKERIAQTGGTADWTGKGAGAQKNKNQWSRKKQMQNSWMDEDDSARAMKLRCQIVLRNVFDKQSILQSGRTEQSYIDELREDILEDYLDWNPQARTKLESQQAAFARDAVLPGRAGKQDKVKPPVRIMAFLGAADRGFVTVQFEDPDEAEMYKSHYNGRKFDGRIVSADFHDGVDLKKGAGIINKGAGKNNFPFKTAAPNQAASTSSAAMLKPQTTPAGASAANAGAALPAILEDDVLMTATGEGSASNHGTLRSGLLDEDDVLMEDDDEIDDENFPSDNAKRRKLDPSGGAASNTTATTSAAPAGLEDLAPGGQIFEHVETNDDWLFADDDDDEEDDED